MASPGLLRRTYDSVALVALLNVAGLLALIGFLAKSGAITGPKVREVMRVVRGEGVVVDAADAAVAASGDQEGASEGKVDGAAAAPADVEVLRLEAERIKTELDQRLALNNSIMLRVMTEREAFRKEQQAAALREQTAAAARDEAGFRKQIAIYQGLPAKLALQHLLDLNNPDEAARILLELETPQAKKIVESAKRGEDMVKIEDILRRVRDVAPGQAVELSHED